MITLPAAPLPVDISGTSLLVALVPVLPLIAMLVIASVRPRQRIATRLALGSVALAGLGAGVLLVRAGGGGLPGPGGWLVADRVGASITLLAATVAVTVIAYAGRALAGDPGGVRFAALAAGLTAATSTLALAGTLVVLAVAWIAVGVLLVAALAIRTRQGPVRVAVRRTRASFLVGDVALLAAVVLVTATSGQVTLDRRLDALVADLAAATLPGPLATSRLDVVAVLLVVAGVSRSALLPLHRWLPATLAAPTPVSAMLHAGVVNGAGVLLLAVGPVVLASAAGAWLAFSLGAATAIVALGVMLVRADIKGALVWSTSAQMGFMVVQAAIGALGAALVHLIGHGLYKAAAFLGAGGRVTEAARARHRQVPTAGPAWSVRLLSAVVVPLAATGAAFALVRPGFGPAKALLIAVLLTVTLGHLLTGWLATAPLGTVGTLVLGGVAAPLLGTVYLGGIVVVEAAMGTALPAAGPASIGVVPVVTVLAGVALLVLLVQVAPAPFRVGLHAWLVGVGTAPDRRAAPRRRAAAPEPRGTSIPHATTTAQGGITDRAGDRAHVLHQPAAPAPAEPRSSTPTPR